MLRAIRAAVLVVAGLASIGASAATYNAGTISGNINLLGTHNVGIGSFNDTINFSLANSSNVSAGADSFQFNVGATSIYNIAGLSLNLFNSGGTLLGSGTNFNVIGAQPAGSYYVNITGTANGALGGLYSVGVNLSPAVSPVPEPETWAMMLGGLGLVASAARRKKAATALAA